MILLLKNNHSCLRSRLRLTLLLFFLPIALAACQPETDSSTATRSAVGADNTDITYDLAGSGDITLIFVHGWSCDRTYWREQVSAFKKTYRVVTMDLGGHGDSGAGRTDWSMESFGRDVKGVADDIDARNIVLIGHSMGGPVVLAAAQQLGDRVIGVVGVDTLQRVGDNPYTHEAASETWAPFAEDFPAEVDAVVRRVFFRPDSPQTLIDEVASDMAAADPEIAVEAGIRMFMFDAAKALRNINDIPVTLLNADSPDTDEAALIALHPKARVVTISDAGHFLMMEVPEAFNKALQSELDQIRL